jgi:predicted amidophosphoribosyltransferase
MEIALVIFWLLCGFGSMAVADQRGGSGCAGLALGFLLGPVGLALSFAIFKGQKCPRCQSTISAEAARCPKCQSALETASQHPGDPEDDRTRAAIAALRTGAALPDYAPTPEPTKRCPFCAEEILVAAKKCKHCGEFLARAKAGTLCFACGSPLIEGLSFCGECGKPVTDAG